MSPGARRAWRSVLAPLWLLASSSALGDGAVELDLAQAFGFNDVRSFTPTDDGVRIEVGDFDAHFALPLEGRLRDKKLRLEFRKISGIHTVQVFYGFSGKSYSADAQQILVAPRLRDPVIDIPLPNGRYRSVRIDLDTRPGGGWAQLAAVRVLPTGFYDGPGIAVVLTLLAGLLTVGPGLLLYVLVQGPRATAQGFAIWGFAASVIWGVLAWAILWRAQAAQFSEPGMVVLAGMALALAGALAACAWLRRWADLARVVRELSPLLAAWFAVLGLCAFIVLHSAVLPLYNLSYNHVSGPKTFGAFNAHDNFFQFENARALADDLPLREPYQRGRLIFQPEDREILPGVLYAPVFAAGAALSPDAGRSYLSYTLLGTAFNLMVLWPLAFLLRRYYRGPAAWALLAVAATAFGLCNLYLTWFKFAGAALFLSALLFMLRDEPRIRHWLGAGLLFGVSVNMHASAALGLPLIFLWLAWRSWRSGERMAALAGPAALVLVFAVLQAPWALVKWKFFDDQQNLLKSFFLAGKHDPEGLLASARLFFESVPLADQIAWRVNRLRETWQLHELGNLIIDWRTHGLHDFLLRWNRLEFGRTAVVFYPLLLFSALGLAARWRWPVARGWLDVVAVHGPERRALVWLSFATLLLLIMLAYGTIPPYVPGAQPMALLLLAYALLSAGVLAAPRVVGAVFAAYVIASAVRLGMFL